MQESVYGEKRSVFGCARNVNVIVLGIHRDAVFAEFGIRDRNVGTSGKLRRRAHRNKLGARRNFFVGNYPERYGRRFFDEILQFFRGVLFGFRGVSPDNDFVVGSASAHKVSVGIVESNLFAAEFVYYSVFAVRRVVGLVSASDKRTENGNET